MKKPEGRRPDSYGWYLALIFILVAGLLIWAALALRVDRFIDTLKENRPVSILFVSDDGEKPWLTETLLYHPETNKGALVAVPEGTGSLLESVDRVDRLESIYDPANLEPYREAVGRLLGRRPDFVIRIGPEGLEKLVDHLEGVEIFIPNPVDEMVMGERYLFPPGSVTLYGAKARAYLAYAPESETYEERTEREHRFVQSLLRVIGEKGGRLTMPEVIPRIEETLETDLDRRALISFLEEMGSLDTERLVMQQILGVRRMVDGQEILFPYYDGKLIQETVARIEETLEKTEAYGNDTLTVSIEILNGTEVNGLASRTAQIYRSYGFRIAAVKNADRNDYERTIVLDRRGNRDAASRAAELIRAERIHTETDDNRDETVDVTVILGKDFDGRYVKE